MKKQTILKIIALAIVWLMVTISVPNLSILGLAFGTSTAEAQTATYTSVQTLQRTYPTNSPTMGSMCNDFDASYNRCIYNSDKKFYVSYCPPIFKPQWSIRSGIQNNGFSDPNGYSNCKDACENNQNNPCLEPYLEIVGPANGATVKKGDTTMIVSSTNYLASNVLTHRIVFDINGNNKGGKQDCSTNADRQTCEDDDTYSGWADGTVVKYWSEMTLDDGTRIRNPGTGSYSFTLSSIASSGPGSSGVKQTGSGTATVTITSPTNGATIPKSVTITATATTTAGASIAKVEFYQNSNLIGTATVPTTGSTYGITWDASNYVDGSYFIDVLAYDSSGNIMGGDQVLVTLSSAGNSGTNSVTGNNMVVTYPSTSGTITTTTAFTATVTASTAADHVDLYLDDNTNVPPIVTTSTPTAANTFILTLDINSVSSGAHKLTFQAYDASGANQLASADVPLTVDKIGTNPATTNNGLTFMPQTATEGTQVSFQVKFNPVPTLKQGTSVNLQLYNGNALVASTVAVGIYCPSVSCDFNPITIPAAGTYTATVIYTPSGGTPLTQTWPITITSKQQSTAATSVCPGCMAAGGQWCIQRSTYNLPVTQCMLNGAACPTGFTSYPSCPDSITSLCQEACEQRMANTYGMNLAAPFGVCTELSPTALMASIQQSGQNTQIMSSPVALANLGYCSSTAERCYCYSAQVATAANIQQQVQALITGSGQKHWPPSDGYYMTAPPKATTTDLNCAKATDVKINAQITSNGQPIGTTIVAAGQPITVEGDLLKMSNLCNGYQYSCQSYSEQQCVYVKKFFSQSLTYRDCPTGMFRLEAKGEQTKTNWGVITSIAVIVVAIIATIAFPPSAAALTMADGTTATVGVTSGAAVGAAAGTTTTVATASGTVAVTTNSAGIITGIEQGGVSASQATSFAQFGLQAAAFIDNPSCGNIGATALTLGSWLGSGIWTNSPTTPGVPGPVGKEISVPGAAQKVTTGGGVKTITTGGTPSVTTGIPPGSTGTTVDSPIGGTNVNTPSGSYGASGALITPAPQSRITGYAVNPSCLPSAVAKYSQVVDNAVSSRSWTFGSMAFTNDEISSLIDGMMQQESRGNPYAVSAGCGAAGILQMMPGTAQDHGLEVFENSMITTCDAAYASRLIAARDAAQTDDKKMALDERFDPSQEIPAAVFMVHELMYSLQDYTSNKDELLELTAASYNGGVGRMTAKLGNGPTYNIDTAIAQMPSQTRTYVDFVFGYYRTYSACTATGTVPVDDSCCTTMGGVCKTVQNTNGIFNSDLACCATGSQCWFSSASHTNAPIVDCTSCLDWGTWCKSSTGGFCTLGQCPSDRTAVTNVASCDTPVTSGGVTITSPANGATVSGTTTITVTAGTDITTVEFWIDNKDKIQTVTGSNFITGWDTTVYDNGKHTIRIIARDSADKISEVLDTTVTVNNVGTSGNNGAGLNSACTSCLSGNSWWCVKNSNCIDDSVWSNAGSVGSSLCPDGNVLHGTEEINQCPTVTSTTPGSVDDPTVDLGTLECQSACNAANSNFDTSVCTIKNVVGGTNLGSADANGYPYCPSPRSCWCSTTGSTPTTTNPTTYTTSDGRIIHLLTTGTSAVAAATTKTPGTTNTGSLSAAGKVLQGALAAGIPAANCMILDNNGEDCYSVCGRNFNSTAGASPTCGGAGVTAAPATTYACGSQSCGSYDNHEVRIEVVHSGDVILNETATTDADGHFSSTFTAPDLDDTVSIRVVTNIN